jgi:hypothetical protein
MARIPPLASSRSQGRERLVCLTGPVSRLPRFGMHSLQGSTTPSQREGQGGRTAMLRDDACPRGATKLQSASTKLVGLVIHDLENPFVAELIVGIERVLAEAKILPLLATTGENPARQAQVLKAMLENGAAGFIVCPALARVTLGKKGLVLHPSRPAVAHCS